jgi:hypothetical protein
VCVSFYMWKDMWLFSEPKYPKQKWVCLDAIDICILLANTPSLVASQENSLSHWTFGPVIGSTTLKAANGSLYSWKRKKTGVSRPFVSLIDFKWKLSCLGGQKRKMCKIQNKKREETDSDINKHFTYGELWLHNLFICTYFLWSLFVFETSR